MEELITKAQNGDEEAFSKLILSISDDLYKIARTRLSVDDDIDDAIQETMIETYKSIKKLKEVNKFKKWVITILINKCNRIFRRKYKKDVFIEDYNISNLSSDNISLSESKMNFYDLIKDLKYEERIILILYYMEEYSVKDIKKILKMNENTVNTHLYRARQKLKNKYDGGQNNE